MTNNSETFLVDTNVFIHSFKNTHPFDLFPSFWKFLESQIKLGKIIVIDKVFDEITKGNDKLADWMKSLKNLTINPLDSLNSYKKVLVYIKESPLYNQKALKSWADDSPSADPWLIATAMDKGFTIATREQPNKGLGTNPASEAKIPDVCKHFNVKCCDLNYVLRTLDFKC